MPKLTGNCLCRAVSFEANGEPVMQANYHCKDCRQVTGAVYDTLVFMQQDDVKVSGEVKTFEHRVDSGNVLTKDFCPNCGSQMFGGNSGRPTMVALRAGSINEQELVKPQVNVFAGSKMDCKILDPNIPAPDKMPG